MALAYKPSATPTLYRMLKPQGIMTLWLWVFTRLLLLLLLLLLQNRRRANRLTVLLSLVNLPPAIMKQSSGVLMAKMVQN